MVSVGTWEQAAWIEPEECNKVPNFLPSVPISIVSPNVKSNIAEVLANPAFRDRERLLKGRFREPGLRC